MKKKRNIFSLLLIVLAGSLLFPFKSFSQKLGAQVSKNKVYVGEAFQLTFTTSGNMTTFQRPALAEFDVSGPSQFSSQQNVNGNISQTLSYSYMIAAKKEGKFTIGAAVATINGVKTESNQITIEVLKGTPPQQNQQQQDPFGNIFPDPNAQQQQPKNIDNEDVFVRTYLNKKQCYLGEQITVTHKIYARTVVEHRGPQKEKNPDYTGFFAKEEATKGPLPINTENFDGITYRVVEYKRTYIFPQRTGKLTVDPIEIDWVVRAKSKRPQTIFDQFFGAGYQDMVVKLKSKPVTVDVSPLPEKNKPAGFTGAVGKFNFSARLNHDKVKANEAINLKLTISGSGNINLAEGPKVTFPDGFETYDPKVNENISVAGGVSGSKTYEYLIVPRREGNYEIKDIAFSYFDLEKKQYVTIPSPELKITVEKGDASSSAAASVYSPKNEIAEQENDIRYIKEGDLKLKPLNDEFFGSIKHYTLLVLPLILFFGFVVTRNFYLKSQSNVVAVKGRKAAKLARKQLALAEKFKTQNKRDEFYNEVLTALNKYTSHKMNIPVADLSKENISAHLLQRNVNADTVQKLIGTLNDCEYARYAPAAAKQDLNLVYNNTIELITKIEDEIK
ncbi:MAG TPA: BatD family protein [Bacteroidia bacterium]|jgi:hypothetical protein|nr:BatD family protein [Bacteroidia bacterium]